MTMQPPETMETTRASFLNTVETFNLESACVPLTKAFGPCTYQVGSSLKRANYRDVDLRCILDDDEFETLLLSTTERLEFLNAVISEWLQARTGLPIDFQFQKTCRANEEFDGPRIFRGKP